jgi:hypothetical protein
MSKERIVVINSIDRISGTNTDFTVSYNDYEVQQVLKVVVKQAYIPNQFYNVTNDNNRFEIKQSTFPSAVIIIRAGQYTIDELILINAYLSDSATVTITKSSTTGKLTFTFSGAGTPANNTVTIFDNDNATAKNLLGISGNQTSDAITLPNPFNLSGVEYVAIHSPQVAYNHGLESGARGAVSILDIVSLTNTPFGAVAYHETKDDELAEVIYTEPTNLSNISIVLRDKNGTKLSLPDNFDCSVIIKVFFD